MILASKLPDFISGTFYHLSAQLSSKRGKNPHFNNSYTMQLSVDLSGLFFSCLTKLIP
jgi:hypothetical protein